MRKGILTAGVLALAVAFTSATSFAGAWLTPNGATANYVYSNGGDDNGLFGQPTVLPEGLAFNPAGFVAQSTGGATGPQSQKNDRLYVTLASPGQSKTLTNVTLGEFGDYSIFNGGGVKAWAYMVVRVLDADWVGNRVFTSTMAANPTMPVTTAGTADGEWTGLASVVLPSAAHSVQVVLNNVLQAYSSPNGAALIEKKDVGITIVIPEPTSLFSVAGLSMLVGRRRKA
jgi:hypothetical protein